MPLLKMRKAAVCEEKCQHWQEGGEGERVDTRKKVESGPELGEGDKFRWLSPKFLSLSCPVPLREAGCGALVGRRRACFLSHRAIVCAQPPAKVAVTAASAWAVGDSRTHKHVPLWVA